MKKIVRCKGKQKIIIILVVGIVFLFSAGYAAFSSNFLIGGKGIIVEKPISIDTLKDKKVDSGDGLYIDSTEENRYVYRGESPDNYISFNNELWRIIGIESDNSLKIMSETNTGGAIAWDNDANPDWKISSLNKHLNETYYPTLNEEAKQNMTLHEFNIGKFYLNWDEDVSETSLLQDVGYEKREKWEGNVGVLNATDFIKSSLDSKCISGRASWLSADDMPCRNQNWLYKNGECFWTINSNDPTNPKYEHNGWLIHNYMGGYGLDGKYSDANAELKAYPVVFLKPEIMLTGKGTKDNPYFISK